MAEKAETEKKQEESNCVKYEILRGLIDPSFLIAFVLIVSFVVLTYLIIVQYTQAFEFFRELISIWAAWIGSVIGYYFGSRPVEILSNKIDNVIQGNEEYEDEIDSLVNDLDKVKENYQKAIYDIQYIISKYKEEIKTDTSLLERLKNDYGVYIT